MERSALQELLEEVASGRTDVTSAVERLRLLPEACLDYATLDRHRVLRQGHVEVVLGERKTAAQIAGIVEELARHDRPVLVTRVDAEKAAAVAGEIPVSLHPEARALTLHLDKVRPIDGASVAIVTAGTSDFSVAAEAEITARVLGLEPVRYNDVGVAGLHRMLSRIEAIAQARVVIVVAGMEGALPSVIGGMLDRPIIAVPTSVGYGAGAGGQAALLGMLNSCASGLTVVNIDNGFGAAYAAYRILHRS